MNSHGERVPIFHSLIQHNKFIKNQINEIVSNLLETLFNKWNNHDKTDQFCSDHLTSLISLKLNVKKHMKKNEWSVDIEIILSLCL